MILIHKIQYLFLFLIQKLIKDLLDSCQFLKPFYYIKFSKFYRNLYFSLKINTV